MAAHPFLGVIGGNNVAEFEQAPPPWAAQYLQMLAVGNLGDQPLYICSPDKTYVPPGAGMALRKLVVEYYLQEIASDPVRQGLDPVGEKLSRSGDVDMALCAWELKLAKGYFPELRLTHIIPAKRLQVRYLADLFENTAYCDTLLLLIRGLIQPNKNVPWHQRLWRYLRWRISLLGLNRDQIQIESAGRYGIAHAHRVFLAFH